jgi:hypothetical protein
VLTAVGRGTRAQKLGGLVQRTQTEDENRLEVGIDVDAQGDLQNKFLISFDLIFVIIKGDHEIP